jgi:hypothetical protein
MNINFVKILKIQNGQTLIETLVAIFMLIMGVSAAAGLAIYALNSSTTIVKQIIGNGLAREGVEAVKNMRDTNWLQDTLSTSSCYDYASAQTNAADCYKDWLTQKYCIDPTANNGGNCNGDATTMTYNLSFDASQNPDSGNFWTLNRLWNCTDGTNCYYGLDFDPNVGNSGLYYADNSNINGSSEYYRRIIITKDTSGPFNPANSGGSGQTPGPKLIVKSQVWWVDRKCPRTPIWPGPGQCSVEVQSALTNWKNY